MYANEHTWRDFCRFHGILKCILFFEKISKILKLKFDYFFGGGHVVRACTFALQALIEDQMLIAALLQRFIAANIILPWLFFKFERLRRSPCQVYISNVGFGFGLE